MKNIVRKAVIPAAGLGTRFLPVTKSVPKELLPIVTKPTLLFVIEEAVKSGIEEIIFVTSAAKSQIMEFFTKTTAYTRELERMGKSSVLNELGDLISKIKVVSVNQEVPQGLGHAVLCAKKAVANEPFIVILPDIIIESKTPCCRQLIDAYHKTGCSLSATEHTPQHLLHLYGIYDIMRSEGRIHWAKGVVEKPASGSEPSDLSVVGRYLFTPEVFEIIEKTKPGRNNEIQLADAMDTLAKKEKMAALEYEGRQFDTGDPIGFLKANIYYGWKSYPSETSEFISEMLKIMQGVVRP